MAKSERVRETAPEAVTPEFLKDREQAGWRLVALEWERPVAPGEPARVEVPYGWSIASDGKHLEENGQEQQALTAMMDLIVGDMPLSAVAAELNARGLRMRTGAEWTAPAVFDLLPRLVESGPRIFASEAWAARRRGAGA